MRERGLSPRGRGNRDRPSPSRRRRRSIPAWAGKPRPRSWPSPSSRVYPRVGGETGAFSCTLSREEGLSPRGRGNLYRRRRAAGLCGSIPAWAGKPPTPSTAPRADRVYPRVGGETSASAAFNISSRGLSPRGRGNQEELLRTTRFFRSIPAWAGKPASRPGRAGPMKVYPRVGGETSVCPASRAPLAGLSPRGRGNRDPEIGDPRQARSIPAWAGKPPRGPDRAERPRVYPRVGGETSASF